MELYKELFSGCGDDEESEADGGGKEEREKAAELKCVQSFFKYLIMLLIFCSTTCGDNIFVGSCRHTQPVILGHLPDKLRLKNWSRLNI